MVRDRGSKGMDGCPLTAPPRYLKMEDFGKVLLLLRSLYGLKQAGFEWSEELEKFFLDYGFTCSHVDQAVYFKRNAEEHTIITVSVDDMAVTSKRLWDIEHFKVELHERFNISDLGELTWLLGLKVEQDRPKRIIAISQKAYVETILERFRLQDTKSTPIPMNTGTILSTDQSPSMSNKTNEMGDVSYQRGIGSLMYAATSTHSDIVFPVVILSQFMRNLGRIHWEVVKDVIRYSKGTADLTLMLGGSTNGLEAYVDANWALQPHRHSMSGYTVLLHSSLVMWSAQKQSIILLKQSILHSLQSCTKYFICRHL
jgi:hypothetical protein